VYYGVMGVLWSYGCIMELWVYYGVMGMLEISWNRTNY
jgi:hypothetical protein